MDSSATFVTQLTLQNENATVPLSIFCLKNLQHLSNLIKCLSLMVSLFRQQLGTFCFIFLGIVPDSLENLKELYFLYIYEFIYYKHDGPIGNTEQTSRFVFTILFTDSITQS